MQYFVLKEHINLNWMKAKNQRAIEKFNFSANDCMIYDEISCLIQVFTNPSLNIIMLFKRNKQIGKMFCK